MTDDVTNNAEEAPEQDVLLQDDLESSVSETTEGETAAADDSSDESGVDHDDEGAAKNSAVFSDEQQEAIDKMVKRAKRMGFDRGERKALNDQGQNQGRQEAGSQDVNAGKVFDSNTNTYIDPGMSIGQYQNYVTSLTSNNEQKAQPDAQQSNNVAYDTQAQSTQSKQNASSDVTPEAVEQIENVLIQNENEARDFIQYSKTSFPMINTVARAKDGVEMLMNLYKSNPKEYTRITHLPDADQVYEVRKMLESKKEALQKKLITKAVSQPKEIKGSPGSTRRSSSWDDMREEFLSNNF